MVKTISTARTIPMKLETSQRKNEYLREAIEEWQEMLERAGNLMPSIGKSRWGDTQKNWISRLSAREYPKDDINIQVAHRRQAFFKASEAFGSWKENGCQGERPSGGWGGGDYMRIDNGNNRCITIDENGRGYGIKLNIVPYNPEWFHLDVGPYEREYCEEIVNGAVDIGASEVRFKDDGPHIHLVVTRDVEVVQTDDADAYVGVDLGENTIYAATVMDEDGNVESVEQESGDEFRHHRDRLDRKKAELEERGELRSLKKRKIRNQRRRYTNQITNVVSKRIVDIAAENYPSVIALEDLTHYREDANSPIHDWPFAEIQEKIAYKANDRGLTIEEVDPEYTSQTCRKCGARNSSFRDGDRFHCKTCDYQNHADVNASMNIAQRAIP